MTQSPGPSTLYTWTPQQERLIIGTVSLLQFVNVVDFMLVMPMGPDLGAALGVASSKLGLLGGVYTGAGALAGVVGSVLLDRFDRKSALLVMMLGLLAATLGCGLAWDWASLLGARVLAGLAGGTVASLSLSVVGDGVPQSRRGWAMSWVMGAFSLASILGVPMGLELARQGGWRFAFYAVSFLAGLGAILCWSVMPPLRGHLDAKRDGTSARQSMAWLKRPEVALSYAYMACAMVGLFLLTPNFSAYFQKNLDFPRERLSGLYLMGGIASLFTMRLAGLWVDRKGALKPLVTASFVVAGIIYGGYYVFPPAIPIVLIFVGFMVGMSIRGVSIQSLNIRVPSSNERARYMSGLSAVQHGASALGAFAATGLLSEGPGGRLEGMQHVAALSIAAMLCVPLLARVVEGRLRTRG